MAVLRTESLFLSRFIDGNYSLYDITGRATLAYAGRLGGYNKTCSMAKHEIKVSCSLLF